jgi:hypothetical protein
MTYALYTGAILTASVLLAIVVGKMFAHGFEPDLERKRAAWKLTAEDEEQRRRAALGRSGMRW